MGNPHQEQEKVTHFPPPRQPDRLPLFISVMTTPAPADTSEWLRQAKRLLRGRGCTRNYEQAVDLLDLAVRAGDVDALYLLGKCYLKGIGCPRDPSGGVSCLERAALTGHAAAAYRLGECFRHGQGAPRSSELAAYWYRKAAALHHPQAYTALLAMAGLPSAALPSARKIENTES